MLKELLADLPPFYAYTLVVCVAECDYAADDGLGLRFLGMRETPLWDGAETCRRSLMLALTVWCGFMAWVLEVSR